MAKPVTEFYDRLSPEYRHNMGWDWEAVMRDEGATLSRLLEERLGRPPPLTLLDCSCGIGTQAIGLALQDHQVHATDLSPVSIECASREAADLGADMTFGVADYRNLEDAVSDTFDVVLSCDNSIAHCLTDDDLDAAITSMKARLNPGGLLLISLRDYAALVSDKPRFNNEHVQDKPDGRRVVFQLWDWASTGDRYVNNQFLLKESDGGYEVKHFRTQLRALLRDEVLAAVEGAEFQDVRWHVPEQSGYYQPIVTARNQLATTTP
ncbi:MAG: class I SAM-dependent methyltransferase [Woeseia sp.]